MLAIDDFVIAAAAATPAVPNAMPIFATVAAVFAAELPSDPKPFFAELNAAAVLSFAVIGICTLRATILHLKVCDQTLKIDHAHL